VKEMKTKIPKKEYDLYKEIRKHYSDEFICHIYEAERGYGMSAFKQKEIDKFSKGNPQ
jgi:hypothetical protein